MGYRGCLLFIIKGQILVKCSQGSCLVLASLSKEHFVSSLIGEEIN
jgi:hypothetical protein